MKKKMLLKFSILPTLFDVQELMGFILSEPFFKKLQLEQLESTKKYIEKLYQIINDETTQFQGNKSSGGEETQVVPWRGPGE